MAITDDTGGAVIVVVDDQDDSRILLMHLLRRQGYAVIGFERAEAALESIRKTPPDLILLDVQMPGLDGYSACSMIKSDPATMLIPVIIVTALDSSKDKIQSIESGADEFLVKPVNKLELVARVRSLLRLQRARQDLEELRIESERRKHDHIRAVFSRYLNPQTVSAILERTEGDEAALLDMGERRPAVVMFCDLRGFTAMSESLQPSQVVSVLNAYFSMLIRVASRHEGTSFGMAGDSLLVGFGLSEDSADRACMYALNAAADMQREFERLAEGWNSQYGIRVGLGIGINEGDVIVGNIGSALFMNYTMIGDTVNVAARIESLARSGEVLCTAAVCDAVKRLDAALTFERLADQSLHGKLHPVPVFRLQRPIHV